MYRNVDAVSTAKMEAAPVRSCGLEVAPTARRMPKNWKEVILDGEGRGLQQEGVSRGELARLLQRRQWVDASCLNRTHHHR